MTEYYTVKRIDNSRLAPPRAARQAREIVRWMALGGVLAGAALLYAWQHFQCIEMRYRLEVLRAERARAGELNQQLKLEVAGLRSPLRIEAIARRELGLSAPAPGQVARVQGPADGALAQARAAAAPWRP